MKNSFMTTSSLIRSIMFIFSLNLVSLAQIASYDWAKQIGGSLQDESFSVASDYAGNSYLTGIFSGSTEIGDTTLNARGATDIFLVKYDPSGKIIWIRQAGGKEDDDSYAIHIGGDGYCYLTGSFADTAYFENDTLICFDDNIFYFDIFLAKYTLDGELIWVRRAGEEFWDEAFGICSNTNGDVFITGSYWGTAKFDNISISGLYGMGATDGFDIFIAKYDSSGTALWANRMVEQGWDRGSDVATDLSGNCYVTGGFQTALRFGGFGGPSLTATGESGDEDIFLVKYDLNGTFIWKASAGGNGLDQARAIWVDGDSNIYLTGVFNETASFDSTHEVISHGFTDAFLAKYDSNGQLLWVRGAGSEGEDGANDVITDSHGNIYICGYIGGVADFDDLQIIGGGQFISKYDTDGRIIWVKQIEETDNLAKSITLLPDGDLVMTGVFDNSATFGSTVLNSRGQTDVFITKFDSLRVTALPTLLSTEPRTVHLLQNYPNPFNASTMINFNLPFTVYIELSVYNLLGQKVITLASGRKAAGRYEVQWDASAFPSGVYYYRLSTDAGFTQSKKLLLLK